MPNLLSATFALVLSASNIGCGMAGDGWPLLTPNATNLSTVLGSAALSNGRISFNKP